MNYDQIIQEILQHLKTLNDDYTQLAMDVAVLKAQMAELLWYFKAVMVAFIGLIVSQIWQLIVMKKNNYKK
jgi:hypothetical protein